MPYLSYVSPYKILTPSPIRSDTPEVFCTTNRSLRSELSCLVIFPLVVFIGGKDRIRTYVSRFGDERPNHWTTYPTPSFALSSYGRAKKKPLQTHQKILIDLQGPSTLAVPPCIYFLQKIHLSVDKRKEISFSTCFILSATHVADCLRFRLRTKHLLGSSLVCSRIPNQILSTHLFNCKQYTKLLTTCQTMCINIHMNTTTLTDYRYLQDLSTSLALGGKKRRVQIVMPDKLVQLIDKVFPHVDRSTLVSQAFTDLLLHKHRITNPDLEAWVAQEQYDTDRMEAYIRERENEV